MGKDTKKVAKPKGPTVAELAERLTAVEHRLGIDHEAIAADAAESAERGAELAPLSEPAVEDEAE